MGHADMNRVEAHWHAMPLRTRPVLVTMLRAPVRRLISEFYYARNSEHKSEEGLQFLTTSDGGHHTLFERLSDDKFTLLDYAKFAFNQSHFGAINNRQAWLLSGRPQDESEVSLHGEMTMHSFERATYRLSAFDYVGVSERFAESVQLLLRTFVQRHVLEHMVSKSEEVDLLFMHTNKEREKVDEDGVSRAEKCELARLNIYDLQLYFNAVRAFDEQLCSTLSLSCHAEAATSVDLFNDCEGIAKMRTKAFAADELKRLPLNTRHDESIGEKNPMVGENPSGES